MKIDQKKFLDKLIEMAKKAGAQMADALTIDTDSVYANIRLRKLDEIERSQSQVFALRVIIDGKQSIVSSTDYSDSEVKKLVKRAIDMAEVSIPDPYIFIADKESLAKKIVNLDLFDSYEPSVEELIESAKTSEDAALSVKNIINSDGASSGYSKSSITFATSNGFIQSYRTSSNSISVSCIAGKNQEMQSDYYYSNAIFRDDLEDEKFIGKKAAELAVKKLFPKKIATEKMPVIFDPRVAKNLLAEFAGAINGSMIIKGTSFLRDALNQQIFNTSINIIDDPLRLRGHASRPFDAEGIESTRQQFVTDGILNGWLLDLRTAKKLGLKNTGNASRGLNSPPSPSPTNFYIENGLATPKELMSNIKRGLYITELFGHGGDIITGNYSQGAFGYLIENGEITSPVNEITIAGNLKEMFKMMTPANDLEFRYSKNSPTLFIEEMIIAGA